MDVGARLHSGDLFLPTHGLQVGIYQLRLTVEMIGDLVLRAGRREKGEDGGAYGRTPHARCWRCRLGAGDGAGIGWIGAAVGADPDAPGETDDAVAQTHGAQLSGGDAYPAVDVVGDLFGGVGFAEKVENGGLDRRVALWPGAAGGG